MNKTSRQQQVHPQQDGSSDSWSGVECQEDMTRTSVSRVTIMLFSFIFTLIPVVATPLVHFRTADNTLFPISQEPCEPCLDPSSSDHQRPIGAPRHQGPIKPSSPLSLCLILSSVLTIDWRGVGGIKTGQDKVT